MMKKLLFFVCLVIVSKGIQASTRKNLALRPKEVEEANLQSEVEQSLRLLQTSCKKYWICEWVEDPDGEWVENCDWTVICT